jgi:hypothetical protein
VIKNPFEKVCYKQSKAAIENFFRDPRMFKSFMALEPLIREKGYLHYVS